MNNDVQRFEWCFTDSWGVWPKPGGQFVRYTDYEQLRAERDALRKLCPSVEDLETGEKLHPDSTITVGLGYLGELLDDRTALSEARAQLKAAQERIAWFQEQRSLGL